MTDLPPILEPAAHRRHWLEYVATGAALLLSAVSLWVAVGTMDANKKMVAAASWPFLQSSTSDGDAAGNPVLRFEIINSGVGPAMVENFEVFYRGKAVRSSHELMQLCCGYDPRKGFARDQPATGSYQSGTVPGTVIRPGESRAFFIYAQTATNTKAWTTLRDAVSNNTLTARACYCSVFDECWQDDIGTVSIIIRPKPVARCEMPSVPYIE